MTKLSIIVPVYNVEKYIRPCFESIFKQGLSDDEFEIIIINDGSTDNSMEMISEIISQHNNITIINQENQGLSVARNNGIATAKGEYILMPDSDDILIENSLKPLLDNAVKSKADLVVADFLTMTDKEIKAKTNIQQKDFCIQEKNGKQLFLEDLNPYHCFVWRTLYRKEFIKKERLQFYPGIRFQDIPYTYECYLKANKCLRISWLLNIYRKWAGASTGSYNAKKLKDYCMAISLTWDLTHINYNSTICNKIKENMWVSFTTMIRHTIHEINNFTERDSIIEYLREKAPDLYFRNGIKQHIVSFLYKYRPHIFIRLYYCYVIIVEDRFLPFYYKKIKNHK